MATSLISLLVICLSVSYSYAGVAHLPGANKLMYVGSKTMNLTSTQRLCKSLGGELPTLKNYDKDLETMRRLTFEPFWLGVARIPNPVHPKDPNKPFRKYTWQDGSPFADTIAEEIPHIPCNTSCCSLRLRPNPTNTALTEVNCNSTLNMPLCVITLTPANMAKILSSNEAFTENDDKLGLAMHVLPKFTTHLYDKVEGHRKTTHPILYVLLAVCLSALMVIAVMVIIYVRGNKRYRFPGSQPLSPLPRKENGQQQKDGRGEEENTFLEDISHPKVISTDI